MRVPELPILVDEDMGLKLESFSIVTAGAIARPDRYFLINYENHLRRLFVTEIPRNIILLSNSMTSVWRCYMVRRGKKRRVKNVRNFRLIIPVSGILSISVPNLSEVKKGLLDTEAKRLVAR